MQQNKGRSLVAQPKLVWRTASRFYLTVSVSVIPSLGGAASHLPGFPRLEPGNLYRGHNKPIHRRNWREALHRVCDGSVECMHASIPSSGTDLFL